MRAPKVSLPGAALGWVRGQGRAETLKTCIQGWGVRQRVTCAKELKKVNLYTFGVSVTCGKESVTCAKEGATDGAATVTWILRRRWSRHSALSMC